MREQPYALWRHDREYRHSAVFDRHLRHVGDRSPSWGDALPGLFSVTAAAWTYLCPAECELREPRNHPFAPESD
ncbi:hypothetical protein [Micromonospora sp. NPDC049799]|uniref:hypothetical protein n=1 Tax=Micromonospora sp. NPDC049799 TaxID=3154741 RepID=UPI0034102FCA